jgi:hypothetical protein
MENNVPYIVHEGELARAERHAKRLIIALVLSILLMFASNALWLYAWMQYDYTSEYSQTVAVDGKNGIANYIGNNGDIANGKSYGDNNPSKAQNTNQG